MKAGLMHAKARVIGLDGTPLSRVRAGIGRYVFEVCRRLDRELPDARFVVYSPRSMQFDPPSRRWELRVDESAASRMPSSYLWLRWRLPYMLRQDGVDVFWATRTLVPFVAGMRTVMMVHDLNHRLAPWSMPVMTRLAHRVWYESDVARADVVVSNSEATARRLLHFTARAADAVARPGVDAQFMPPDAERAQAVLRCYGVGGPYFLAVGTLEPRKNLTTLIEAFVALKRAGACPEHRLLLVGAEGWGHRQLRRLLHRHERLGISALGYVPDDDLVALYARSEAFVIPSLYEGFGMPAAEALACGARVVATDIPELREATMGGAIYVEPSIEGVLGGLRRVLEQPGGTVPPSLPTWDGAARVLAHALG